MLKQFDSVSLTDLLFVPVREKHIVVSDNLRHKPLCTVTKDGKRREIWDLESRGIVLSV